MNKKITAVLTTLGIVTSSSMVLASSLDSNEFEQIFSSKEQVVLLSDQEMQATQGQYSVLSVLLNLSALNLDAATWETIAAGINNGSFQANPAAFLQNLGIDPNVVIDGLTAVPTASTPVAPVAPPAPIVTTSPSR